MKKFIKSLIAVMLSLAVMIPYVSMAAVTDNSNELKLNKAVEFEYTYNEERDNGKVVATYTFVPDSTDYYDVTLSDFIREDTFLGIFDEQGNKILFKSFADSVENDKCSVKLTAGNKYYLAVFCCKPEANGNNDFNAEAIVGDVKFPSQPEDIKCTANIGTKLGFSRCYKADALKGATKVDIFVNFNSAVGEQDFKLFIGPSCNNQAKTKNIKISSAGWYTLDISDLSIDDISNDDGVFFVGFEALDRAIEKQLVSCVGTCSSDYFGDFKLYSMTKSGTWVNQNATTYNGFCAVFYQNKLDFKLTRNVSEVEEKKPLRIIFISDSHYGTDSAGTPSGDDTYDLARGTRGDERTQLMVDAINAEHHKAPVDFVIFAGDLRSISASNRDRKVEDLQMLNDRWLSQLEMPYYAIRGNHDAYTNEEWQDIFGNDHQFTIETEDYAFICVDVYDYAKSPFYDSEGNNIPTFKFSGCDVYYSGMAPQMDWLKSEVEKAKAKGKKIWIVSHHLSHTTPSAAGDPEKVDETEFIKLFSEEDSIIGIIKGHAHIPGLTSSLVIADKEVNDGNGYNIPKWNINTGNFGAIPAKSNGTTPDNYRFGFKVLEMQEDGLKAYHVYPAETYPRWKTSGEYGVYDNKTFEYTKGTVTKVDDPKPNEKDKDIKYKSSLMLIKHNHSFTVDTIEPTCENEGRTMYTCIGCAYTYTETHKANGHQYYPEIINEASCSQTGEIRYTCSACSNQYAEEIAKLPHNYNCEITAQPTCKKAGSKTYTCADCSNQYTEEIPALQHKTVIDPAVESTCYADGKTEGSHCALCGEVLVAQQIVKAGHRWNNGVATKPTSCNEDGTIIYTCTSCGEQKTVQAYAQGHSYREWIVPPTCTEEGYTEYICSGCGESYKSNYTVPTGHNTVTFNIVPPTCTQPGFAGGSSCTLCGHIFVEPTVINPLGLSEVIDKAKKATCNEAGLTAGSHCSVCGETIVAQQTVAMITTVKLSATSYTYDGKVKAPNVIVKDSADNIVPAINYTVSYASGCKNVGKYAVKITFKGNYSGTKTLYFTINPKNTSISGITASSKKITVKLKKYTTQTTGYQIQYATNAKFTSAKTVTVNNKTISKTIGKLAGKKKYYVRVRTYKTVGSAKYYSSWSKAKTVTTKK